MFYEVRAFLSIEAHRSKTVLLGLMLLALAVGLFELAAVLLIIPTLAVIVDPASLARLPLPAIWDVAAGWSWRRTLVVLVTLLLLTYAAKAALQVYYYRAQTELVAAWQRDLAVRLMRLYLQAPYTFHLRRNSAEIIRNMTTPVQVFYGEFLNALFSLAADAAAALALIAVLLAVAPGPALAAGTLMITIYVIQHRIFHRIHVRLGEKILQLQEQNQRELQHGLGALKELRVGRKAGFFLDRYARLQGRIRDNIFSYEFSRRLPPLFGDVTIVLCMTVAILVLVWLAPEPAQVVASLGLLAAAAFRLSPLANRIIGAFGTIHRTGPSLKLLADELRQLEALPQPRDQQSPTPVRRDIALSDVAYVYPGREQPSLRGIDLTIARGEVVGIIGPSGAGKTTLVDILLGLLVPSQGAVLVDGDPLRGFVHAGYVPQDVFVLDDTVRRNIAFGVADSEIEAGRMQEAIRMACLDRVVNELPEGLNTRLGERGRALSGGQKQRIGIARALYEKPELLVMDEATSAMDARIEEEITDAIADLRGHVTTIVIAHRLSTIRNCDLIVMLERGRISDQGRFDELLQRNEEFKALVRIATLGKSDRLPEAITN
jgi:ATP-binding cassette subfamily C protein